MNFPEEDSFDTIGELDFDMNLRPPTLLEIFTGGTTNVFTEENFKSVLEGVGKQTETFMDDFKEKTDDFGKVLEDVGKKTSDYLKETRKRYIYSRIKVLQEKMKTKKAVVLQDKITFVLGVCYIWTTTLVLARFPAWMPLYYVFTVVPMIVVRFFIYKAKKWHFFLADLCYFVNALLVLILLVFPAPSLFSAVFCLAHGPVAWAVYAWKNSLVFHSLDKITSVAIHVAPAVTLYTLRWMSLSTPHPSYLPTYPLFAYNPLAPQDSMNLNLFYAMFWAGLVYLTWQALYYYFILILNGDKVFDYSHATSYTWLLKDYMKKKNDNPITALYKAVPDEYRPFLFIFMQFIYALATMAPAIIYYHSFTVHTIFIVLLVMLSIFNGADYYIEVFSRRYAIELARLEEQAKKIDKNNENAASTSTGSTNIQETTVEASVTKEESKKEV